MHRRGPESSATLPAPPSNRYTSPSSVTNLVLDMSQHKGTPSRGSGTAAGTPTRARNINISGAGVAANGGATNYNNMMSPEDPIFHPFTNLYPRAATSKSDDDPVDKEGPFDKYIQSNLRSRNASLPRLLVLSLSTLADLGPSSPHSMLPFVNYVVSMYLGHWDVGVRGEAVETCCRLLGWQLGSHATRRGGRTGRVIEGVLLKLLRTAVSDPSPDVRHTLVLSLDYRYDPHLCQAHHLSTLFLLVQDEVFAIRACALKLLGRLAVMNPAYVLPALRDVLMRLVLELQCNGDTSVRESATRTLIVFLRASALQRLVRPFLNSLVDVLPVNEGVAPRLAAASLEALGEVRMCDEERSDENIQI